MHHSDKTVGLKPAEGFQRSRRMTFGSSLAIYAASRSPHSTELKAVEYQGGEGVLTIWGTVPFVISQSRNACEYHSTLSSAG